MICFTIGFIGYSEHVLVKRERLCACRGRMGLSQRIGQNYCRLDSRGRGWYHVKFGPVWIDFAYGEKLAKASNQGGAVFSVQWRGKCHSVEQA